MPFDGTKQQSTRPQMPVFKTRWWHRADRLDIRPLCWGLRNRPEQFGRRHNYVLAHAPSKHKFWIGNGFWFYGLYRADCSCSSNGERSFTLVQKWQFGRAFAAWRRWERTQRATAMQAMNEQFRQHFAD